MLSACALSRLEPLLQTPTTVPVLRTRLEGVAPNPLTQEDISLIPASVLELRFSVIGHCMGVPPAFLAPSSHLLDPRPQVWGALVEADSLDEVPLTARHHQSTVDQAEVVEQGHIQASQPCSSASASPFISTVTWGGPPGGPSNSDLSQPSGAKFPDGEQTQPHRDAKIKPGLGDPRIQMYDQSQNKQKKSLHNLGTSSPQHISVLRSDIHKSVLLS